MQKLILVSTMVKYDGAKLKRLEQLFIQVNLQA